MKKAGNKGPRKNADELELEEYIREGLRMTPLERLRYAESRLKSWYEIMPEDAKTVFEKLRWKDEP